MRLGPLPHAFFHGCRLRPRHAHLPVSSLCGVTHVPGLMCYLCTRFVPSRWLTLIRPPVVNRESSPAAGFFPREQGTTWGPRGAADFISRAASDTVVCTKHLLRLELETTTCSRHQRGEQQRLRGLETHGALLPADSRRRVLAEGQSQLARSSGEGQPTARRVNVAPSDVERARESNQRTGLRDLRTQMLAAVAAARRFGASARARSHGGSS